MKSMLARLSVLACLLCVSGYVAVAGDRMETHYSTVYGRVGESLKNPDNELDFVDIDWADIDNYAGEDFGEASFTVDKTTLPKWLKWESVTTTKDKNKRVVRNPDDTTWWYADGGKYYPISGTPTEAGTWNVKVTAQWSDGVSETVTIAIVVKDVPKVVFDANGGKIGTQTKETLACAGDEESGFVYAMPDDPVKSGVEFDGWWTAKEGGALVEWGDAFDPSIFANPQTPTLYAQWSKARKITVSGGFLDDETTSRSGLYRGAEVGAYIDEKKLYDTSKNEVNAFVNWSYTPATADLGEGFDPFSTDVTVMMPNADVKLTANYVNGFAGYLVGNESVTSIYGVSDQGDFYWSIDNGKTLFPFGEQRIPVKAGSYTVKFYDKTGIYRASDMKITVAKRGTRKEGGKTYYDEPVEYPIEPNFVPVIYSTEVKFDANGGSTSCASTLMLHECSIDSLPSASRKGYVFAGWWTAKDGGTHVAAGTVFDPSDFAGQKTPTIYAHWLQIKKLTMKDDSAHAQWALEEENFEDLELYYEIMDSLFVTYPNLVDGGSLEGKGVLEVLSGAKVFVSVNEYSVDKSGKGLAFQKWSVTPSKANLGSQFRVTSNSTELTMPSEDVTLQASYIDDSTSCTLEARAYADPVSFYDFDADEPSYIYPPYAAFEWSPDNGSTWYKVSPANGGYDEYGNEIIGETALLKPGTYTVTWRSTDPHWIASETKTKVVLEKASSCCGISSGCYQTRRPYSQFTYVPEVVVDVLTYSAEEWDYVESSAGGTVTMNPKDGLVPIKKTITLTAKANKNYAFQGYAFGGQWWALSSDFVYDRFEETSATWKLENSYYYYDYSGDACFSSQPTPRLQSYIDPSDHKVHIVALFKALADYSEDDIEIGGFSTSNGGSYEVSNNVVNVRAVVGCAIENSLYSVWTAFPLTYKIEGKLPDGLKFDGKTGVLSGAPKKAGNFPVKIVASDPAKNSKTLTVNISVAELPTEYVGEYRGTVTDGYSICKSEWNEDLGYYEYHSEYVSGQQCGLLEMTVKADGKVSAKVITRQGSRSVSGALEWRDPELTYFNYYGVEDEGEVSEFRFWHTDAKDSSCCHVNFRSDGTIDGEVRSYDKIEDDLVGGNMAGLRQNKDLLAGSNFLDKYYTFAFCAKLPAQSGDSDPSPEESEIVSGYGYLTIKTDKTGAAKVAGQLPDGEKVSLSALVMPFEYESTEGVGALLYLFASPSSYKKQDWFVTTLTLDAYGNVTTDEGAWTIADVLSDEVCCGISEPLWRDATLSGTGALYSEAKTLEGFYWMASCAWSNKVLLEYSYKYMEENEDNPNKPYSWTEYDNTLATNLDGYFFNVEVKGDSKGAISLVEKNNAFSISFTKATGIFSGKATVNFDYWPPSYKQNSKTKEIECVQTLKHATATLPYAGVMIDDGKGGYTGLGSAVHTYKHTYWDEDDRAKTVTEKITLPVSLDPPSNDEP